jgi:hypothetical protein
VEGCVRWVARLGATAESEGRLSTLSWKRGPLVVERLASGALWVAVDGEGLLVEAPAGTASALGERVGGLRSIVLLSGRLERVSGLVSVFARLQRPSGIPLTLRCPLSDERATTLAEAWQRAWGAFPLTIDAIAPGHRVDVGSARLRTIALSDPGGGPPPMGIALTRSDATVAVLPRCRPDGAARSIVRGADLLVAELGGGGLSASDAVELAGEAELWVEPALVDQ